jgi:iron complex outermembrane recepter protein
VLPSSASGIYGGSAIGGVVNIILKSDYQGGEITATYETPEDTDAPIRSLSANYGFSFEGGRTHVALSASWKDTEPMRWQDRQDLYHRNRATLLANFPEFAPDFLLPDQSPSLGSLPNILPNSTTAGTLTLKDGLGVINSRRTFIPAGTSPTTPRTTLAAGLLANAGQFNLDPPPTAQDPIGLFRRVGTPSETKSFRATVRRQMFPRLELMADFMWADNQSSSAYVGLTQHVVVQPTSPANPFTTAVRVRIPDVTEYPIHTRSLTRRATVSAFAKLPWDWIAALDVSHSENRFMVQRFSEDTTARNADLNSGVLNPFVDTLLHPLNWQKYVFPINYTSGSEMTDFALRGSGPMPSLPWGQPQLTVGLERRIQVVPERTEYRDFPITITSSLLRRLFEFETVTDSVYAEARVPLVKQARFRGLHDLELQLSGRSERYEADTGTAYSEIFFRRTPAVLQYSGTSGAGTSPTNPFIRGKDKYDSTNYTVGVKYQPIEEITVRASHATAILPPSPLQLMKNAENDPFPGFVNDPVTGAMGIPVVTRGGGNPNLKPQSSESLNLGVIWAPSWTPLKGLRLNAEYYRTEQAGRISGGDPQIMVYFYPERVTRDSSGNITLVDTSMINMDDEYTSGWDFSASYAWQTGIGSFDVSAVHTIIEHLKNQTRTFDGKTLWLEAAGYHPNEAGAARYKSTFSVGWRKGNWSAGWSGRYVGKYHAYQAAGGPIGTLFAAFGSDFLSTYTRAQGGDTISSQIYHDLVCGYDFRERSVGDSPSRFDALRARVLSGLSLQIGVRNVFDQAPPLDSAASPGNFYLSPYGDNRLRSWWLSVKKTF